MPELPEVETNVRALLPHLKGRKITRAEVFTEKLRTPLNIQDFDSLSGKQIVDIRRRAKYIIVDLEGAYSLLVHLGMTGSFRITGTDKKRDKHEHLFFYLDNGKIWRFRDPRKFGLFETWKNSDGKWPEKLAPLGPEPLSSAFNGRYLKENARNRSAAVKNFIMDQHIVVGVGNIYANEALFAARIHPQRPAERISLRRYEALATAIKKVLAKAIDTGGTTIINYRNVDGNEGRFALELAVYGKAGDICPSCGKTPIKRMVIAGRSAFYCPYCQR